jgi:hypothetical protein
MRRDQRIIAAGVFGLFAIGAAAAEEVYRVPVDLQGVTIEVAELKLTDDGYITMRGRFKNESGQSTSLFSLTDSDLDGVTLLDMTNRRKHMVVKDSSGKCFCGGGGVVGNGESRQIWAKFAPPPDGVTKMSVSFGRIEPVVVPVSR